MKRVLLSAAVLAVALQAQTTVGPRVQLTYTLASPPTVAAGTVLTFSDATAVGGCTAGGSSLTQCRWSGSAWQPISGTSTGSGPVYTTTSYSATPTFSVSTSTIQVFTITLTGNVTSSTLSGSLTNGQDVTFNICQDGTGSRTFVWPTNVTGAGTINPQLSTCSRQTFRYDGTNAVAATSITCPACSPSVIIPGSSSGQSTVVAPATGGGTVTLFAGSDTVVGKATTDTLSNKTLASGTVATTQAADDNSTKIATTAYVDRMKTRGIGFTIGDPAGSALSAATTTTAYVTVPFACTISAYNLIVDAGTVTVKFWKVATGTAIPTSSNSINTSGVGISTGTAIHSATVSDFTTTTVTANDIMAMNVTVVATAKYVQGVLQCDQ